jgi:signal transduction histidine kinase
MSEVLEKSLRTKSKPHAERLGEIAGHVRNAISHTRSLARGLSPVTLESEGLMAALHELSMNATKIFNVDCTLDCDPPVRFDDHVAATQLFRIAQEAVSNSIRHGKANRILVELKEQRGKIVVTVSDNGSGLPEKNLNPKGMGLRIMQSRSGLIGGTLVVENGARQGVRVACSVPRKAIAKKQEGRHAKNQKN